VQAGNLYRLMREDEKKRLVENIAVSLSAVTRDDIIERSISHFRNADADYGERVAKAVKALRARNRDADVTVQTDRSA
jgi:catalase